MIKVGEDILRRLEELNFAFQMNVIFEGSEDLMGAHLGYSNLLDDAYSNFAQCVGIQPDQVEDFIKGVTDFYKKRDRKPAVYVSPYTNPSNLEETLKEKGFKEKFTEAWIFYDLDKANEKSPEGLTFRKVESDEDAEIFAKTFQKAYSGSSPNEPYGALSPVYLEAFHKSLKVPQNKELIYLVGFLDGEPACTGSLCIKDQVGGLYSLGTDPKFRGKGLGKAMANERLRIAKEKGCKYVFCITEKDSYNEKLYHSWGHETKMIGKGLVLSDE